MSSLSKNQFNQLKQEISKLAPQKGSLVERRRSRSNSRGRMRSRSSSRSKRVTKTPPREKLKSRAIGGAEFRSAHWRTNFLKAQLLKLTPVVKAREEKKKALLLASSAYFVDQKDVKSPPLTQLQKELEIIENELKLMVSVVKAGLGNRPIRMKLWVPWVITATVTTGIVNTVTIGSVGSNAIQPSFCSEWPSLISLFDEYKMHGGTLHWLYMDPVSPTSLNSNGASSIPAIGYDPSDNVVANAVNTICQLSQHKLYGTASDTWAGLGVNAKHEFKFVLPKGVMMDEVPTGSTAYGDQWIACDAASAIHGWIKHYHQGAVVTAVTVGAGQASYDLEFRCRS